MNLEKVLTLGDRVDLCIEQKYYRSTVQDILSGDEFIILHPSDRHNIPIQLNEEEQIDVIFFRENGQFVFQARPLERARQKGVAMLRMLALSEEPQRFQRRDGYRLLHRMRVELHPALPKSDEKSVYHVHSIDLSDGGIQVEFPEMTELGEIFEIEFTLDDFMIDFDPETIMLRGVVSRVLPPTRVNTPWGVGLRFLDSTEDIRRVIARFILKEQIENRKRVLEDKG